METPVSVLDEGGLKTLVSQIKKYVGSAAASVTTDYELSDTSTNAVQNKTLTAEFKKKADDKPQFTTAAKRENIMSGEPTATLFGKIAKWFSDLHETAFSGDYEGLVNKPEIPEIPKNVGAFENDKKYVTEAELELLMQEVERLQDMMASGVAMCYLCTDEGDPIVTSGGDRVETWQEMGIY